MKCTQITLSRHARLIKVHFLVQIIMQHQTVRDLNAMRLHRVHWAVVKAADVRVVVVDWDRHL